MPDVLSKEWTVLKIRVSEIRVKQGVGVLG